MTIQSSNSGRKPSATGRRASRSAAREPGNQRTEMDHAVNDVDSGNDNTESQSSETPTADLTTAPSDSDSNRGRRSTVLRRSPRNHQFPSPSSSPDGRTTGRSKSRSVFPGKRKREGGQGGDVVPDAWDQDLADSDGDQNSEKREAGSEDRGVATGSEASAKEHTKPRKKSNPSPPSNPMQAPPPGDYSGQITTQQPNARPTPASDSTPPAGRQGAAVAKQRRKQQSTQPQLSRLELQPKSHAFSIMGKANMRGGVCPCRHCPILRTYSGPPYFKCNHCGLLVCERCKTVLRNQLPVVRCPNL